MSDLDIAKGSLTPQHLIMEMVFNESPLASFVPSIKVGKVGVVSVKHIQVMRYVYTLVAMEDVYFEGRKLPTMPGMRELLIEWVKPGKQIVSVPNGNVSVAYTYMGKKNIFQGAVLQRSVKSFPTPFIKYYGEDPAPTRRLYGNPNVPFVQRGDNPPTGAAYFNSASGRFEIVQNPDRRTLLENFMRRFSHDAAALAG